MWCMCFSIDFDAFGTWKNSTHIHATIRVASFAEYNVYSLVLCVSAWIFYQMQYFFFFCSANWFKRIHANSHTLVARCVTAHASSLHTNRIEFYVCVFVCYEIFILNSNIWMLPLFSGAETNRQRTDQIIQILKNTSQSRGNM